MPLYDYKCVECGIEKEVQHSMDEIGKIEIRCDACELPMKKLLSAPTLLGFDNVGRSISKKDKNDKSKNLTSQKDTLKKDTPKTTATQKKSAA